MSTGPPGVSNWVSKGPKLPYGDAGALDAPGPSSLATLMRIVAFSAAAGAGASTRWRSLSAGAWRTSAVSRLQIKTTGDHLQRLVGQPIRIQTAWIGQDHVTRIGAAAERTADRTADVVDQH